jgi:hypothetical protein
MRRHRSPEEVPLALVNPEANERLALKLRLDPLADQLATGLAGEMDETRDERLLGRVDLNPADQTDVQLDEGRSKGKDVASAAG